MCAKIALAQHEIEGLAHMATFRKREAADGSVAVQAIIRRRVDGILHSERKTFTGEKAEQLARAWAEKVEKQVDKIGPASRKLETKTLGELIEDYEAARRKVRLVSRGMEHELAQLAEGLGSHRLSALRSDVFTKWAMQRRAAGAGPATVLHNLSTLRSVLGSAKAMFGYEITAEPVAEAISALWRLGAVAASAKRDRRVSVEELAKLVEEFERIAFNPSTIIPMAKIVQLAVDFPRRLGELTGPGGMLWEDFDGTKVVLRDTKHPERPRTEIVPVPRPAQEIIKSLPRVDARILPYKSDSVSAAFDRACERLEIEDLHFHDLRHEGISRLFEQGLEIQEVALISGHLSWNTLKRYTHLRPEKVLEKLDGNVRPVASPPAT